MGFAFDRTAAYLGGGLLALLLIAGTVGLVLSRTVRSPAAKRTVDNLNARTLAWAMMTALLATALALGRIGVVLLFALVSFQALRELVTLAPTRRGDHRALFWAFFVAVPAQYWLVYADWEGLFMALLPVWGFLFFAIRSAVAGDTEDYLRRTAEVQWAVTIGVFCLSHVPGLLMLDIEGFEHQQWKLVVWLLIVAQMSDVLQYVWGKLLGKHPIAPRLSPNKTVEGFVGGVACATGLGAALWWATPFSPQAAAGLALLVCLMGFSGGLVMSAVKRDVGIKDYGDLIPGHGGVMDRVDSLAFAAPAFFHAVRYWYT